MDTLQVRVAEVRAEAAAIRSLRLAPVHGPLPTFAPGAHIRVVAHRSDGTSVAGAYSLVNDPIVHDYYEIGVRRLERGGTSDWLHSVEIGSVLTIEPPRNDFPLAPQAAEHVLIGGGIGVTPLLSMAAVLARTSAPFTLWALARSRDGLPFAERLAALPAHAAHIHLSREAGRCDVRGLLARTPSGGHIYVCGPRALIESVHDGAAALGIPVGRVHSETFGNGADALADREFDVELRVSRLRFRVGPGQTILERAEGAGLFVSHDCRRGQCGTCLTRVLDGVPDHRDTVQTESEKAANEFMAICCSRASTESIVLDL